MFVFKKHVNRRTFLRGVGATVALPLLDAMVPVRTALAAGAVRPATRMLFVYFPHGAMMDAWTPADTGRNVALGRILEPLAPFADRMTVISGIENLHAYGPVHAITPGTWLGRTPPGEKRGTGNWTTVDQVAAAHLGRDTLLSSIEAATEQPREIGTGPWEGHYGNGYAATISFREAQPRPMEVSPRRLFDRMFVRDARVGAPTGASVLDLVADAAADLARRLGARDRTAFREYLDHIREVERRVDRVEERSVVSVESPETEDAFAERLSLMFDLIALAFRADITRVASYMMAAETSLMTYRCVGVTESFHLVSHHQYDPVKIEALVRIQRYHTGAFARFVRTLADLPDGDESLLNRSLILYGSNMSDSYRHDHYPLPLTVVGRALYGGGHVRLRDRTPMSDVLVTLLQHADVPIASIGHGSGDSIRS